MPARRKAGSVHQTQGDVQTCARGGATRLPVDLRVRHAPYDERAQHSLAGAQQQRHGSGSDPVTRVAQP